MNEEIIDDLKQFIQVTVSQATAGLATTEEMNRRFDDVDRRFEDVDRKFEEVDRRFDDVDLKLSTIADAQAETLAEHEHRLTKLEKRSATA